MNLVVSQELFGVALDRYLFETAWEETPSDYKGEDLKTTKARDMQHELRRYTEQDGVGHDRPSAP